MTRAFDLDGLGTASSNGEAKRITTGRKGRKAVGSGKATRRELSARRRIALGVGGVGCFVLALSVSHCTDALVTLTGSSVWLAGLLAVGIDVGMVACEVATAVAGKSARTWGKWYVGLAVVLSMLLNALASAQHAEPQLVALAYAVGAVVPVLVFMLGQVASKLWTEG